MSSWLNKASDWVDSLEQRIEENKSDYDSTFGNGDSFDDELGYKPSTNDEGPQPTPENPPASLFDLPTSIEMNLNLKQSSPESTGPDNSIFKSDDHSVHTLDSKKPVPPTIADDTRSHQSGSDSKSNSNPKGDGAGHVVAEQHQKMVKLWEKERANLKKAQQLLLEQKEAFNLELDELEDSHQKEIDEMAVEYDEQIAAKNKTIALLEESLADIKEERNHKIEGQQELHQQIAALEAQKEEMLKGKAAIQREKQEQIASIRKEFEVERRSWEKERKILTKNFERENYLENENVQSTNALARSQSALQQKELENARLQGEIRWLKQDKEEIVNTNAMLKGENDSCQQQIESLNQIVADKNKEIVEMKDAQQEVMHKERAKYSKLQIEYEKTKENMHQMAISGPMGKQKKQDDLSGKVKELRDELLTKQTDLDRVVSQRNEYRIRLTKMEGALTSRSREIRKMESGNDSGLTRRGKRNVDMNVGGRLPQRKYTKWKAVNDSIGLFDRLGLEFAHVLRNKPWLRLLIVFYIIVLHLWCFMVLHFSLNFEQDEQHY